MVTKGAMNITLSKRSRTVSYTHLDVYKRQRNMCKKDSSFVTIISGCDVSDEDAEKVTEIVKAKCPNHVEVSHIRGGQPVYYYMISVE